MVKGKGSWSSSIKELSNTEVQMLKVSIRPAAPKPPFFIKDQVIMKTVLQIF